MVRWKRTAVPLVGGRYGRVRGDAAVGEPLDGSVQDGHGGDGGRVVVDPGVRVAGMVVDDGVDERVAELGVARRALRLTQRFVTAFGVLFGDVLGRDDRSCRDVNAALSC